MKLKCDELLSSFAFNVDLRQYATAALERLVAELGDPDDDDRPAEEGEEVDRPAAKGAAGGEPNVEAGRCRLTPG